MLRLNVKANSIFGLGGWSKDYDFDKIFQYDEKKYELCSENGIKIYYYTNVVCDIDILPCKNIYKDNLFFTPNDILKKIGIN